MKIKFLMILLKRERKNKTTRTVALSENLYFHKDQTILKTCV